MDRNIQSFEQYGNPKFSLDDAQNLALSKFENVLIKLKNNPRIYNVDFESLVKIIKVSVECGYKMGQKFE